MLITAGLVGLLKLASAGVAVGLSTRILLDLKEKGMLKLPMLVKTLRSIPLAERHMSVLGMTRNGKTYAVLKSLEQSKKGVLFFNLQQEKVSNKFVKADGNASIDVIKQLLDSGEKINFIPSSNVEIASKQLIAIINALFDEEKHDIIVAIDEVHLYDNHAQKAMMRIATAGLRWGFKGIFITQRPANMNNNLLGQSETVVSFNLKTPDREYLRRYGYPVENMMAKINEQKYHFIMYEQNEVKGAFKIG